MEPVSQQNAEFFRETEVKFTTIRSAGLEDQPVSSEKDRLGFRPYVQAVFSFLCHPSTKAPFTLSIEGDWGSGKSSFMLQLSQALEKEGHKSIHFNAWRHDKVQAMWAGFALHFVRDLLRSFPWYLRPFKKLSLYFNRINFSKGWFTLLTAFFQAGLIVFLMMPMMERSAMSSLLDTKNDFTLGMLEKAGWAGILFAAVFLFKKITSTIGNPLTADLKKFLTAPDYAGNISFIEDFHRDFEKVLNVLVGKDQKVFVFIDDLDRTEMPRSVELMEGLNLMISNSPKLIFIIGMDREKVAAGVAYKYKDMLPYLNPDQNRSQEDKAVDFGYSFLEKFIQLSFRIPGPSRESLKGFLEDIGGAETSQGVSGNNEITYDPVLLVSDGQDSRDFVETVFLVSRFFENNPRRLKQFINAFRLKAHIAHSTGLFKQGTGEDQLTIQKLGKFVAIVSIWPDIVEDLYQNPDLFKNFEADKIDQHSMEEEWANKDMFAELLKARSEDGDAKDYSLAGLEIVSLLQTSPSVSPRKERRTNNFEDRRQKEAFSGSGESASFEADNITFSA